uniref:ferroxidase n=1 Tax=Halisarca dujardinii TaxID=2583056 RepID=A0A5J6YI63_HALDU|nr:frataxin [Halisarca dujardinii]QSX72233.1 frataxin [Halisarca dujardinii]
MAAFSPPLQSLRRFVVFRNRAWTCSSSISKPTEYYFHLHHRGVKSTTHRFFTTPTNSIDCFAKHSAARAVHTGSKVYAGNITDLDDLKYSKVADETLEELSDFFENLGDTGLCPSDYDVEFGSGVLTVTVGHGKGTYVINKQAPNKQIWLSSPISGPKRYDVVDGRWAYSHEDTSLHDLLSREFSSHLDTAVDLTRLNYSRIPTVGDSWA